MSAIAELARGVVMTGVAGPSVDASLPLFGGYLLFPRAGASLEEVRAVTDALRARQGDLPPVIAIDQEGGAVVRLRKDVEPMPSMMALGAADDVELAQRAGEQIGVDLRRAGCTLNVAPVLDLALEPENAVIGTRSFGADPQLVASLGASVASGLIGSGVLPCYKHFPGHGSTSTDSHEALPVVDADEATLRARDLVPFARVARAAPAIMSGHVLTREFDRQRPATLSPRVLRDLLRGDFGFCGTLVTDCLEMTAVAERGSVTSAVAALAAGADLLLFSHNAELAAAAVDSIEKEINEGRLTRERLEEAHARVVKLRKSGAAPLPLDALSPHTGVGREIGRRAVTLLRGLPHADPVASIAVSFGHSDALLKREAPALEEISTAIEPTPEEMSAILERLEREERRPVLLARRAHRHPAQVEAIARIVDCYPDSLVVSALEPYDVPLFGSARHLLATCGDTIASIGGLADVIFGGSMPTGHLPL